MRSRQDPRPGHILGPRPCKMSRNTFVKGLEMQHRRFSHRFSTVSYRLGLLFLGILCAGGLRAEEVERKELISGDTAYGQEAGELEFEFETTYTDGAEEDEYELRLGMEYGITDRIQFEFGVPYLFVDPNDPEEADEEGFDLAEIAFQFALLGPEAPMALSLVTEVGFPVAGREGPGDDEAKFALAILGAYVAGSVEYYGGLKATWSDEPTEHEIEAGVVYAFERSAIDFQVTYLESGGEDEWELTPEFVIEDLGPFDLGIGVPYTIKTGKDEWGAQLTLTFGLD